MLYYYIFLYLSFPELKKRGRLFKICHFLACIIICVDRIVLRYISPIIWRMKRICSGFSIKEISATPTVNLLIRESSDRVLNAFQEWKCRSLRCPFRLRIFLLGLIIYVLFLQLFFHLGICYHPP